MQRLNYGRGTGLGRGAGVGRGLGVGAGLGVGVGGAAELEKELVART
jgi:hypothetical protein